MDNFDYQYDSQFTASESFAVDADNNDIIEGSWGLRSQIQEEFVITSMNYDTHHELLWVGNGGGRVTSYMVKDNMERYSSFLTAHTTVSDVLPASKSVLSIAGGTIRMHTDGGIPITNYRPPTSRDSSDAYVFTCGELLRKIGGLLSSNDMMPSHLMVGTSGVHGYVYDLSNATEPLVEYELGAPSICCRSSGLYNIVGGGDGKIRLLDGRLRMKKISHVLEAHTGIVNDIAVQTDDVTLLSCGMMGRAINPFDPSSPLTYSSDHVVRVFDLRMLRQLSPVPLPLVNTAHVRFLPAEPHALILFASSDGLMQTYDPAGEPSPSPSPSSMFYAPLTSDHPDPSVSLSAVAVSSSGQLISVGSSTGQIAEFAQSNQLHSDEVDPVVNLHSLDLHMPPSTLTPTSPLTIDSPVLANVYVLKQYKYLEGHEEPLLSSFLTTPSLLHQRLKLCSSRKISDDLLSRCVSQDFIGTTPNPGFPPNSMIHAGRCISNGQPYYAYAVCDPRSSQSYVGSDAAETSYREGHPPGSVSVSESKYRKVQSYRGKQRKNQFDYGSLNSTGIVCLENVTANSYANSLLQILYLLPEVRNAALLSQASIHHHQDEMSVIPTLLCELGFLFEMIYGVERSSPDVPRVATAANFQRAFQQIPEAVALGLLENGNNDESAPKQDLQSTVQVFVRFLLHQLQKECEQEMSTTTSNVQKTRASVDKTFGYDIFCSNHFRQEVDPRGLAQGRTRVRAVAQELVYPSVPTSVGKKSPSPAQLAEYTSFSAVLWFSLRRETSMRGWCSTTETYEALRQRRCVDVRTISNVLTITCGDTMKDSPGGPNDSGGSRLKDYWQRLNSIKGPWLPSEIEIWQIGRPDSREEMGKIVISSRVRGPDGAEDEERWLAFDGQTEAMLAEPAALLMNREKYSTMIVPGGDEQGAVVRMNLFAVISQVPDTESDWCSATTPKHLILHCKRRQPARRGAPMGSETQPSQWILINDMVSEKASMDEVFHFDETKHPCVLFFTRNGYQLQDTIDPPNTSGVIDPCVTIPPSVFQLKSLSSVPCVSVDLSTLPGRGDLVAFDAEFVTVELEKVALDSQGQRIDSEEGRQVLARISLLDGENNVDGAPRVLADDCVLPTEPVVDYVTRFSGITEEDLTPSISRCSLVTHRTAYLKLRCLVDRGCIIVGHGLKKDFDTANIFVSPHQIRDTVELWRLPQQRKISLRFLAAYLLHMCIQDEVHDSIEDAKTALELYRHYIAVAEKGNEVLAATLNDLYTYGARTNWTIGLEKLREPSNSF